jgi:hypothetical protein
MGIYTQQGWSKGTGDIWVALSSGFWWLIDWLTMLVISLCSNEMQPLVSRLSCAHDPVWVQMKMLCPKGHFGVVVGGARPPLPQETFCKETIFSQDQVWVLPLNFLPHWDLVPKTKRVLRQPSPGSNTWMSWDRHINLGQRYWTGSVN